MIKKRILLLIVSVILLIISATGCNDTLINLNEREVTVNLEGLPTYYSNYNIKLFAETDGGGIKNAFEYENVSSTETLTKKLKISREADFILAYIFDSGASDYYYEPDPVYFYKYNLSESKNKYNISYWIDYDFFEFNNEIKYGLSTQLVQTVESNMTKDIDFNKEKYYLFKIPSNGIEKNIQINTSISTDEIEIVYDNYFSDLSDSFYNSTYIEGEQITIYYDTYILVTPQNYDIETNGTIEITIN